MNLEWSYLNLIVFASWALTTYRAGIIPILLAGAILFSGSIPICILLYLALTLVSFVVATFEGKKGKSALIQKYYFIRLLGCFLAIFGVSLKGFPYSPLFLFFGLLLSMPTVLWSALFSRHYESLNSRSYLYSVVLPALVALNILMKIKADVQTDFGQIWDISLAILGLSTLIISSVLAYVKQKTKPVLIYLTQAWIGFGLFLLVLNAATIPLAMSSLFSFVITGSVLFLTAKQCGEKMNTISQAVLLGFPGFVGFSFLYYAVKGISEVQVNWIWFVLVAFIFQVFSLLVNDRRNYESSKVPQIRFGVVMLVQALAAGCFFWLDKLGLK